MKHQLEYNYLGIDQYGQHHYIKKHPRKELCENLGTTHADKMYVDLKDGSIKHIGYVVRGLWIRVLRVSPLND